MKIPQRSYTLLFNAFTDALDALDKLNIGQAKELIIRAQQTAEELILEQADEEGDGQ